MEKTITECITEMKKIKKDHGLSNDMICDIISKQGVCIPISTVQRIFAKDSEDSGIKYQTIVPVYDGLMRAYGGETTSDNVEELKSIIDMRDKHISQLADMLRNKETEHEQQLGFFAERKKIFEDTIAILRQQIDMMRQQIEEKDCDLARKDEILESLLKKCMDIK